MKGLTQQSRSASQEQRTEFQLDQRNIGSMCSHLQSRNRDTNIENKCRNKGSRVCGV